MKDREPVEEAPVVAPVAPQLPQQPLIVTIGPEFIEGLAKANAAATKAVTRPENDPGSGISVFDPKGEGHNKIRLSRETFWKGFRLQEDELTPEQIALLNRLTAGTFRDGRWYVNEIIAKPGQRGRLEVEFPAGDIDARMELPRTMEEMCLEMLGEASRATEFHHLADAQAEITRLRQALEAREALLLHQQSAA